MSIAFAGTPQNAAVTLRELLIAGTPISLVLTRPDAPIGRKALVTPSPVALVAREFGIPTLKTNSIDSPVLEKLKKLHIDFALVVAFGVLLKSEALNALPKGWFNLHYSLLPRWRGAAPVQHALLAGDQTTGATIFRIDEGLDTGAILTSVKTDILPNENAGELLNRLTHLGISLLLETIPIIESGFDSSTEQPSAGVTIASKLTKREAQINFSTDAAQVVNQIRGFNPEPGAWTFFEGSHFKIHEARASESQIAQGIVQCIGDRVLVGCLTGSIQLIRVQPSGKNAMPAIDWYRGLKVNEVRLGSVE